MKIFHTDDIQSKAAAALLYIYSDRHSMVRGRRGYDLCPTSKLVSLYSIMDKIKNNECVYIIGYIPYEDEVVYLRSRTYNITWVDNSIIGLERSINVNNFITSKEYQRLKRKDRKNTDKIRTYVDTAKSLPELMWYCLKDDKRKKIENEQSPPEFARILTNYHVLNLEHGNESIYLHYGLEVLSPHPTSFVWAELYKNDFLLRIIMDGKAICDYRDKFAERLLRENAYQTEIKGHTCLVINQGLCDVSWFKSVKGEFELYASFVYDGDNYTVTVWTNRKNINVYELMYGYNRSGNEYKAIVHCPFDRFFLHSFALSPLYLINRASGLRVKEPIKIRVDSILDDKIVVVADELSLSASGKTIEEAKKNMGMEINKMVQKIRGGALITEINPGWTIDDANKAIEFLNTHIKNMKMRIKKRKE